MSPGSHSLSLAETSQIPSKGHSAASFYPPCPASSVPEPPGGSLLVLDSVLGGCAQSLQGLRPGLEQNLY